MKLSNEQYDVAKRTVTVVVPAAIALITGLGVLYKFDTSAITGTIALVATFAGTVLGVSSKNYQKEQEAAAENDQEA
ncbi:holin [Streptococcus virus MS1]|jgi:holin|nr:holin [Streptococcus virus MS1]DAE95365.1 MAG TPA: holin [Caudoviricetes sp.]DAV00558.1 MAG TPA: holin [Caudoviricetes sp.]DAV68707.1 MAG TPA: holin [Caudoviricetes sp.]DAV89780.1 MAG TPA: holin [Caudoviricetes sp.]